MLAGALLPRLHQPFILDCNAGDEMLGDVLYQECAGAERVVAYFSKKLTQAEENCATREKKEKTTLGGGQEVRLLPPVFV